MDAADRSGEFAERIHAAAGSGTSLALVGSGSKRFLGNADAGEPLDLRGHAGIVNYVPDELMLTARAGTRLADIEAVLAEHAQTLGFEPPHFGADATLGGTLAAGLSGPRRASAGAARDFVLGVRVLDGRGDILRFGGEVMKNVAGYDVSRLMVGAFGTLGVILDASLKLLPRPRAERTQVFELDAGVALARLRAWVQRPLPISASAILQGRLYVRLSGAEAAVAEAAATLGGETRDAAAFWHDVREQRLAFFAGAQPLWRLSLAPAAPLGDLGGAQLIEWQGAQRWLKTDAEAAHLRDFAERNGGHATRFRAGERASPGDAFHPLPAALLELHRRLKLRFDPHRVFNRGRLYPEL